MRPYRGQAGTGDAAEDNVKGRGPEDGADDARREGMIGMLAAAAAAACNRAPGFRILSRL